MPETPPTHPAQPSARPKSFFLNPDLHRYVLNHGGGPDEVQQALMAATQALGPVARMQIAPEQGVFMEWLARVTGARRAIEVGTFTGYSALCLARGLGPQGRLLCLDVNEEWTRIAQTLLAPGWPGGSHHLAPGTCRGYNSDHPSPRSPRSTWASSTPTRKTAASTTKECTGATAAGWGAHSG